MLAALHRDAAHMAIAGAKAAAVIELHIIAEAAGAAGHRHRAVGRGVDRRAIAAREIDAGVHARIAENRMAPPPIARRNAPARRAHHTAAPFADARRLEPLRDSGRASCRARVCTYG